MILSSPLPGAFILGDAVATFDLAETREIAPRAYRDVPSKTVIAVRMRYVAKKGETRNSRNPLIFLKLAMGFEPATC